MSSISLKSIPVVPLDIQIEIMKRLPIKSLIKFISVSKQWKSIIQSSQFLADYNAGQPPRHLFSCFSFPHDIDIFNYDNNSFLQRLVPPSPRPFFIDFIGYSQGLFGFHYCKDGVLVLWNPSIRKSVFILVPPEHSNSDDIQFFFLNATHEPTIFGITYDESWRQVHIHTLTSGVWRTFSYATSRESIYFTNTKVVIDRFIYWVASNDTPEGDFLNRMIVSCDVTSEQFIELCLPPCLATSSHSIELYELRRSLLVVERDIVDKTEFGVWMMMDPPGGVLNSFTKLYTVKMPYTPGICRPRVLGFRKDGQLMLEKNDSHGGNKLLFYEPDSERFNEFKNTPGNKSYTRFVDSYTETLLLLDHSDCISCL